MEQNDNSEKWISVLGIATTFLFVLLFGIFTFLSISNYRQEKEDTIVIEENEKYTLKIEYPQFPDTKVETMLRDKIDSYREEFFQEIKDKEIGEEKFDFSATYTMEEKEGVFFLQLLINSYVGEEPSFHQDEFYYYDKKTKEFVGLDYFMEEGKKDAFLKKVYYQTFQYLEKKKLKYDEKEIEKKIQDFSFSKFSFEEKGIQIWFPEQYFLEEIGEIKILLPYSSLKGIVKEEYFQEDEKTIPVSAPVKRDLSSFQGKKLIAFTFDDGPSIYTPMLLDHLEEHHARVTFFVLGSRVKQYSKTLIRSYEMGNQIGSHTYSHVSLTKLTDYRLLKEIEDTNEVIEEVLGIEPTLLRPPYGNINDHIKEMAHMNIILWNVDTLDWKNRNKKKVKEAILKGAKDGAIILLHDLYETSIEGVLLAMEELEKKGYAFVTIEEMVELKKVTLNQTKNYYSF